MRYARWFWPIVIICFALAAPITMRVLPGSPLRPLVMMVFLFICPGMALIRFLRLRERASKLALALAVSFSVDGLIAGAYLYSHHWSPLGIMNTLALISIVAVIVEVTNVHVALYQHIGVLRRLGALFTHPSIIGTSPVRHATPDIVETPTVQIPGTQLHAQAKGRSYQNGDAPYIEETPTMLLPRSKVTNGEIEDRPTVWVEVAHIQKIAAEIEDRPTAQLGAIAAPQSKAEIEDRPTAQLGTVTAAKTPQQIAENSAQEDQVAANKKRPPMQFVIQKKAKEEEIEHKPTRLEEEMVQKPTRLEEDVERKPIRLEDAVRKQDDEDIEHKATMYTPDRLPIAHKHVSEARYFESAYPPPRQSTMHQMEPQEPSDDKIDAEDLEDMGKRIAIQPGQQTRATYNKEAPRNESGKTDTPGHGIASASQPLKKPGQRPRIGRSRLQCAPEESNSK
ncbi:hypothetical protein ccbrp13_41010 [Ktedonobacteria bacterium brp13]|nr:hypothetical protein ccbrp13_41010 [Ktedonobacteria bacterium brp13]